MGPTISDYNMGLILITVVQLSSGHCNQDLLIILIIDHYISRKKFCKADLRTLKNESTGGPRYIREIETRKIGLHLMNSHIKRPRITIN
jgi:hypothetical protein